MGIGQPAFERWEARNPVLSLALVPLPSSREDLPRIRALEGR
jgi:hypothetical protein